MTANTTPAKSGTIIVGDTQVLQAFGRLGQSRAQGNTVYCKSGAWGATTIIVQQSPDGVNWYDRADTLNANGFLDISSSFQSIRLSSSGGAASVDFIVL